MTINKLLCQPDIGLALVGATQVDATLDVTVFSNDVGAIYSMRWPSGRRLKALRIDPCIYMRGSLPVNGHSQDRRACLTGANFGGPRNVIS